MKDEVMRDLNSKLENLKNTLKIQLEKLDSLKIQTDNTVKDILNTETKISTISDIKRYMENFNG
jgi:hypothetical protein